MKKIFICFFALSASLVAQTSNPPLGVQVTPVSPAIEAPAIVTNKFASDFPNNNAIWTKVGENYAAEYYDSKTQLKHIVVYDLFGNQLSSEHEVATGTYPKGIDSYLKKNYPDTKFKLWSGNWQGKPVFYTWMNKDTIRFNPSGAYIPQKTSTKTTKTAENERHEFLIMLVKNKMKKISILIAISIVLLEIFSLTNCGYKEKGHANTPAETPGSQTQVGVDTLAHPGNIDKDTVTAHQ